MIPIILTSVAAAPNMGVQVWRLGEGRAIPRNFHHAVVNDALVDWNNGGQNYNDVIIKMANGAPDKHAFVTEYSGASSVMANQLDYPGRYGDQASLAASADAATFIETLLSNGFPLSGQTLAILEKYIPVPAGLLAKGYTAANFYGSYRYYTTSWRQSNPGDFTGWTIDYQPTVMAQSLFTSVVTPMRAASKLFENSSVLTRLYTTLSPEDMNKDPAFSFNPALSGVNFVHQGTMTYHCSGYDVAQGDTSATLTTEQGWVVQYPKGTNKPASVDLTALPAALRYEVLPEEGAPEVTIDNHDAVEHLVGAGRCGCGSAPGSLGLLGLALIALRRPRRSNA
jgi:MYXO-CTERM domain-containing protein